jgi:hypothetical protein
LHGTNVTATGYNAGATPKPGEPVLPGSTGKNSWWTWTARESGLVLISLSGSDYNYPVGVFSGKTLNSLQSLGTSQGGMSFQAVQGQTYQIAIGDMSGLTGAIKFNIMLLAQLQPRQSSRR